VGKKESERQRLTKRLAPGRFFWEKSSFTQKMIVSHDFFGIKPFRFLVSGSRLWGELAAFPRFIG
jgi:hypothetical protein